MIGDIASGNTGFADVCFLIAVVVAALAALALFRPAPYERYGGPLVAVAVAAVALGLLVQ